jgi:zinc protease
MKALLTVALAASFFSAASQAQELSIEHTQYELENGLTVILAEDHDLPLVQVNVWYHVGSKDEPQGRSGFAHLFEHLMFQGSEHQPGEYFDPLQEVGARVNGTTNSDRTNYFEGLGREQLPLALWLESDRMGWLLGVLDQSKLDNQREVVRNERRQRYEIPPYGEVWPNLMAEVFPEGHPYHHPTIGSHEDLAAASLEDVHEWFGTWYGPNNASLVVAGDFDEAEARELIENYFGPIARGPEPEVTTAEPVVHESETVVRRVEEGVPYDKVWIAWPSAALFADGDAELDIVSDVLTGGRSSRLTSALVYEQQIAKSVEVYQYSRYLSGVYMIEATAAEGHTTDELVAAIDEVLLGLSETGPTDDELAIAVANIEASFYGGMRTLASKADRLNTYLFTAGTPDYLQEDLNRYLAVTKEGVQEAAASLNEGRVVFHVTPEATDTTTEETD